MRIAQTCGVCLILLFLCACSGIRIKQSIRVSEDDWRMYGGTPARVNVAAEALAPPLTPMWEYDAVAGIRATPLVVDSVVLIVTLKGELQAVDIATGKRLGYLSLGSPITSTPVVQGHVVFAANNEMIESVIAFDLSTGLIRWEAAYGPVESSLLHLGDRIFITTLWGVLHAVKIVDGTEDWKFETGPLDTRKPIRSSPATDGTVIVFGDDDGWIYGVNLASGNLKWKVRADGPIWTDPVVRAGEAYLGTLDGTVYAIDMETGEIDWTFSTGSVIYANAATTDEMVFIGSADGVLHCLDASTGNEVWKFRTESVLNSAPLISGPIVYIGSMDHTLYALQAASGNEVWRTETTGRIRVSPVLWRGYLLVTSEDKYVTAYRNGGAK